MSLATAPNLSAKEDERLKLDLAPTQWQMLSRDVQQVYAAPDGRLWYQLSVYGTPDATVDQLKEQLGREFSQPSPQIKGAQLVLLEAGGRAWFYDPRNNVLLGYDGRTWIDYPFSAEQRGLSPRSQCPSRGRLLDGSHHRSTGGKAWFLGFQGILRFDGEDWSYHAIVDGSTKFGEEPLLAVGAEGAVAVAHRRRSRYLSVFRNGEWTRHQVIPSNEVRFVDFLAVDHSGIVWYVLSGGQLFQLPASELKQPEAETHDAPPIPANSPPPFGFGQPEPVFPPSAFGTVTIAKVRRLYQDEAGRVFAFADSIDNGEVPPGPGIALLDVNGRMRSWAGAPYKPTIRQFEEPLPMLGKTEHQLWLPFYEHPEPARLLDLESGNFIDQIPHADYGWFHARAEDGRVFVSVRNTSLRMRYDPVMVYMPDQKSSALLLPIATTVIGGAAFTVADDGAIWTLRDEELARFDGQWRTISQQAGKPTRLLSGRRGVVLTRSGLTADVYRGEQKLAAGNLTALIEEHTERFRESFSPDQPGYPVREVYNAPGGLLADRSGNVWLLQSTRQLLVYTGRKWLDASESLRRAGARGANVELVCAVGDGSRVFLSNLRTDREGGFSFLGEVIDGQLTLTKVPLTFERDRSYHGVREQDGVLWIPGAQTSGFSITGQIAHRIGSTGVLAELPNSGWARLVDASGSVWLGHIRGRTVDDFNIWRCGSLAQKLTIPATDTECPIVSDSPGSVYVFTAAGLQHLVADAPDYRTYRFADLFSLEGISGRPRAFAYSPLGYLVVATYVTQPEREHRLHLIQLPKRPHVDE